MATHAASDADHKEKWPGNRPPMPNLGQLEQRMDATWGRGKFREEIWEDKGSPVNEWWVAFTPSEEQLQAAAQGFDFTNVEEWCKVRLNIAYPLIFHYFYMLECFN
ncbi:hypothetical protein EON65_49005 [archaeon]|nr:MAG: hypothetical protein EON65_49005 [archaeon]